MNRAGKEVKPLLLDFVLIMNVMNEKLDTGEEMWVRTGVMGEPWETEYRTPRQTRKKKKTDVAFV